MQETTARFLLKTKVDSVYIGKDRFSSLVNFMMSSLFAIHGGGFQIWWFHLRIRIDTSGDTGKKITMQTSYNWQVFIVTMYRKYSMWNHDLRRYCPIIL